MKKNTKSGGRPLGTVLSKFHDLFLLTVLVGVLILAGCKKDSTQPPVAPTLQLSVNTTQVSPGDSVIVNWTSTNATSVEIMWSGPTFNGLPPNGSQKIGPLQINTTITITATGPGGTAEKTKSVIVTSLPPPLEKPSIVITYDTSIVPYGGSKGVSWVIKKATQATLNGIPIDTVGNHTFMNLVKDSTLDFHCSGAGGVKDTNIIIRVASQTTICQMLTHLPYKIVKIDTAGGGTSNWGNYTIATCQLDDLLIFKPNGTFERHQGTDFCMPGSPELFGDGLWELLDNETKISIGGTVYDIAELTSTTFKTYVSQPCSWCVNGALQRIDTYSNQ